MAKYVFALKMTIKAKQNGVEGFAEKHSSWSSAVLTGFSHLCQIIYSKQSFSRCFLYCITTEFHCGAIPDLYFISVYEPVNTFLSFFLYIALESHGSLQVYYL